MEIADLILRIGQVLVALGGFCMVVWTLRQKITSDDRTEWWKRYTWAVEHITNEEAKIQQIAWLNLEVLSQSGPSSSGVRSECEAFGLGDHNM